MHYATRNFYAYVREKIQIKNRFYVVKKIYKRNLMTSNTMLQKSVGVKAKNYNLWNFYNLQKRFFFCKNLQERDFSKKVSEKQIFHVIKIIYSSGIETGEESQKCPRK